jgi:hypothetical protein
LSGLGQATSEVLGAYWHRPFWGTMQQLMKKLENGPEKERALDNREKQHEEAGKSKE